MKFSIVIPCYNEAENIPLILKSFSDALVGREGVEVILVNNNSTDNTAVVLLKLSPLYPFVKTVFEPVPGYGSAIVSGLRTAVGDFIGWTHGDMQTSPADVIRVFDVLGNEKDSKGRYFKGRRLGRPVVDRFFTFGMGLFESLYLKVWLFDINAQPNIFHRSFFEKWKNIPLDFSLDLFALCLAKKGGLKVIRYPVKFIPRIHGKSSWNMGWGSRIKFIKRTVLFSRRLRSFLTSVDTQ